MTPRVVFDCVVCLQGAARETGPAGACFRLMAEGAVTVCVSSAVLAEVTDVLGRQKVRQRFKTLTDGRVDAFLKELPGRAVVIDPVLEVFSYPRDPDDEPYVNLSVAAEASYLVTWDNDLLDLMSYTAEGISFRDRFPGLAVLTPVAFLREMALEKPVRPDARESGEKPGV